MPAGFGLLLGELVRAILRDPLGDLGIVEATLGIDSERVGGILG
jgi:hypothetical protein